MIKLFRKLNKISGYRRAELSENTDIYVSPCRGWFDLFTFLIEEEPVFKDDKNIKSLDDISLVLLLVDIGAARDAELTEEHLDRFDRIIRHYYDKGKDIILRVAYDHDGNGMEKEPYLFKNVRCHAAQISGLLKKYHKEIFIYQGLLIGRWGEMHTSRFANPESMRVIFKIFEENKSSQVFMAVRRPVQWRYLRQKELNGFPKTEHLGIFNDGMFGSDSDLGTYDSYNKNSDEWEKAWNRRNELELESYISESAPYGGEALFGEGFFAHNNPQIYIEELKKRKVTYLNRNYDLKLLDLWKKIRYQGKGPWNGRSYFDYIGAHLGYRFIVKKVSFYRAKDGYELEITIENSGFAPIYRETELYVSVKDDSGNERIITDGTGALNLINPGNDAKIKMTIPRCNGRVILGAYEKENGKKVIFANQNGEDGGVYLGGIHIG